MRRLQRDGVGRWGEKEVEREGGQNGEASVWCRGGEHSFPHFHTRCL